MPAASVMFQGRPLSFSLLAIRRKILDSLYRSHGAAHLFPHVSRLAPSLFLPMQESPACSGDDGETMAGSLMSYGASERACTGVTARKNPCRRKVAAVKIFTSSPASYGVKANNTIFDKRLGGPTRTDDGAQEEDGRRRGRGRAAEEGEEGFLGRPSKPAGRDIQAQR